MNQLFSVLFILFSLLSLGIGIFLVKKPAAAIEVQRKFYAKINWKIEPISMPKEIRNTRLMGLFLIFLSLIIFLITLTQNSLFFKSPILKETTGVYGRGTNSGIHLGNDIWPGRNNLLYIACEDKLAQQIFSSVKELRKKLACEGVKAFILPLEELTL